MQHQIGRVFLLITLAVASILGAVPAAHAEEGCTLVTLKGAWGTMLNGIIGVGPIAQVGVATYDGAGHWSRTETTNVNGNTFPPKRSRELTT